MVPTTRVLKTGDEVIVLFPDLPVPTPGRIIALTSEPGKTVGVELAEPVGFHSCDNRGVHGHCLWVLPQHVVTHAEFNELKERQAAKIAALVANSTEFAELHISTSQETGNAITEFK